MTDTNPTPDQWQLLSVLEELALLPVPLVEDDFEVLADEALDLREARGLALRADVRVDRGVLLVYERGLRLDGHEVAADGVRRMYDAHAAGFAARGGAN